MIQHPGEQGGGGGFAMGTGHDHAVFARQQQFPHEFGQRTDGQAMIETKLDFRVAAFHGVPHHDPVRSVIEVGGAITLGNGDLVGFEEGRHGRVDILVAAGDLMTELTTKRGDRSHGGAADTDEMDGPRPSRSRFDLLHQRL